MRNTFIERIRIPTFNSRSGENSNPGWIAELLYFPHGDDSRWYTAAIFNWVDSDQPDLKYTSAGLHYGYLLQRNVRATVEATYVFKSERPKHLRLGLGLITGF